jgi:hypothetical protein
MTKLVNELKKTTSYVMAGGKHGQKAIERHTSKRKLLVRDRIKHLIDAK